MITERTYSDLSDAQREQVAIKFLDALCHNDPSRYVYELTDERITGRHANPTARPVTSTLRITHVVASQANVLDATLNQRIQSQAAYDLLARKLTQAFCLAPTCQDPARPTVRAVVAGA